MKDRGIKKMKGRTLQWVVSWLLMGLLSACGGSQPQAGRGFEPLDQARTYLETARSLELAAVHPQDFAAAEAALQAAQTAWNSGDAETAGVKCHESIVASRKMMSQFYSDTVMKLAQRARDELERRTVRDPENPLSDPIPALDEMLPDADAPAVDPHLTSIHQVLKDLDNVLKINAGLRTSWEKTLGSDLSFEKGQTELSEEGRRFLKELMTEVMGKIHSEYADQAVTITIKVAGYTDQLGFGQDTPLVKNLIQGMGNPIPNDEPERRRFLNKRLSEMRAESVGKYLKKLIHETDRRNLLNVEMETVGRGEDIPSEARPPYPVADARRRICKIYIYAVTR
jgi:outer membrane protein OmpA-like peptidoglycan-associated protein